MGDQELERTTLGLINMVAYSASSREHARRFADATGLDLTTSDIRVLEHLAGRGAVATSSIAAAMGIDLAQASRQISHLTATGHVERRTDAEDRRRTLVLVAPETARLLDRWLLSWAQAYEGPAASWTTDDVADLATWFRRVLACLEEALPHRPSPTAAQRWDALTHGNALSPSHASLVRSVVDLVAWVAQSGGFNDLLEAHRAPIRQHGYLTLRVVVRRGPLSVAEVAHMTGIDHTQASKRISQLVELELADRTRGPRDRRTSVIRATRRGRDLERRIRSAQLQDFTGILGAISSADRRRWTALTRQYVDFLFDQPLRAAPALE